MGKSMGMSVFYQQHAGECCHLLIVLELQLNLLPERYALVSMYWFFRHKFWGSRRLVDFYQVVSHYELSDLEHR